ncbi:type II toxin-antitoxin system RelE/ParE family toxin [Zooshikella harenae]|uniref:Type II toxin-antitoxin system RelE/ParE family toxin n=1 Tax=Zooshikella harenae TaxID=2827238 RepID=A0ABS5ZI12_9GAMM|nr:type II toxin-antitoxin system RelE/ParE family toxin [Zooshikella harenae]
MSYPTGRHVIFYQVNSSDLEILRITHQSSDIIKYI